MICFNGCPHSVNHVTIDNNTLMREIQSLQIVPIVAENREDVSKTPKVSSVSAESTMSVVFAELVTKLLPCLQRIVDVAEHKHVCKHASQQPRHLAGYSLPDQINPKLVGWLVAMRPRAAHASLKVLCTTPFTVLRLSYPVAPGTWRRRRCR